MATEVQAEIDAAADSVLAAPSPTLEETARMCTQTDVKGQVDHPGEASDLTYREAINAALVDAMAADDASP